MRALVIIAALAMTAPGFAYADGMDPPAASQSVLAPAQTPAAAPTPAVQLAGEETVVAADADDSVGKADVATGVYDASLVVIRTGPARTSSFAFGAAGAATGRR